VKRRNEASLLMEKILIELFGSAVEEFPFALPRKFKADWAVVGERLLVEIEGGVFTRQAHGSITGIKRDMEKYNLAAINGWFVLRFRPDEIKRGEAEKIIREYRKART
jgi:very-short-patch-repair endonuclease